MDTEHLQNGIAESSSVSYTKQFICRKIFKLKNLNKEIKAHLYFVIQNIHVYILSNLCRGTFAENFKAQMSNRPVDGRSLERIFT